MSAMRVHIRPCTKVLFYLLLILTALWMVLYIVIDDNSISARKNLREEVFPRIRYKRSHAYQKLEEKYYHTSNKIPTIIHQTWKSDIVPLLFKPWMLSWLKYNKEWEYWFWTDEDIRELISVRYPHFLEQFDDYPQGGFRPDAFRYFVLHEFGGVYADLDMECLRSLDPIIWQYECVLSQEPLEHAHFLSPISPPLVSNAFMACKPGHNFLKHVIESLPQYSKYADDKDVLWATGPYMLTDVYKEYMATSSMFTSKGQLYLAQPEEYHPQIDESMLDSMREHCIPESKVHNINPDPKVIEMHMSLCARLLDMRFENKPKKGSYTIHYWTHSWAGKKHDPWNIYDTKTTFDIEELTEFHDKHAA